MWPGNTADVTTLIPVVTRLRQRFLLNRVCIIADRGMVSAKTIATLEAEKIEYILGVREKRSVEIAAVLADKTPFVSLTVPKANGRGTRPPGQGGGSQGQDGSAQHTALPLHRLL